MKQGYHALIGAAIGAAIGSAIGVKIGHLKGVVVGITAGAAVAWGIDAATRTRKKLPRGTAPLPSVKMDVPEVDPFEWLRRIAQNRGEQLHTKGPEVLEEYKETADRFARRDISRQLGRSIRLLVGGETDEDTYRWVEHTLKELLTRNREKLQRCIDRAKRKGLWKETLNDTLEELTTRIRAGGNSIERQLWVDFQDELAMRKHLERALRALQESDRETLKDYAATTQ